MRTQLTGLFLACFVYCTVPAQTGQWDSVDNSLNDAIWTLYADSNYLYAGGWFTRAGGKQANYIARWDGKQWDSIGTGFDYLVWDIVKYRDTLYAGGEFSGTGGGKTIPYLAKWDGTEWDSVEVTSPTTSGGVNVFEKYNGELYAGGLLNSIQSILRWDGKKWSSLGNDVFGIVYSLEVFQDTLYVGGDFDSAGTMAVQNIAKWDGNQWHRAGSITEWVGALEVYDNTLYALTNDTLYRWSDNQWKVTMFINQLRLTAMHAFDNKLFVGGNFSRIDTTPVTDIAYLQNGVWYSLSKDTMNKFANVTSITDWRDTLYVGGGFDSIGSLKAKYIAKWHPVNNGVFNPVTVSSVETRLFPNPFSTTATLQIELQRVASYSPQLLELTFYDMKGREASFDYQVSARAKEKLSVSIKANQKTVENGIYFYRATIEQNKIATGKFIIY